MSDEYGKKLAEHQRDVAAGRFGKPGSGNPYSLSYQYGAKLGGRDPRSGQLLNNSTIPPSTTPDGSELNLSTGAQSTGVPSSPSTAVGMLLAVLAVVGVFAFQAQDDMQRTAATKARVAPAASPTHYVLDGDTQYFYADGANRDKPARNDIVVPSAGKCFDLTRVRQIDGRITVDLETYYGRVFRMYTSTVNFARLPPGATCEYGYYSRS